MDRFRSPHAVAKSGSSRNMTNLIEMGVAVDVRDERGDSPLHIAAARGAVNMGHILLEAGIPINALNHGKWTPLHFAAHYGRVEMVQFLLERGADVRMMNRMERTPVHLAMAPPEGYDWDARDRLQSQRKTILQDIARMCPDLDASDPMGTDIMLGAIKTGHLDFALILFNRTSCHGSIRSRANEMMSSVVKTCDEVDQVGIDLMNRLLMCGIDPNITVSTRLPLRWHDRGREPEARLVPILYVALFQNPCNIGVVRLLLDHGADLNTKYLDTTPLSCSLMRYNYEVSALLFNRGAEHELEYDRRYSMYVNRSCPDDYFGYNAVLNQVRETSLMKGLNLIEWCWIAIQGYKLDTGLIPPLLVRYHTRWVMQNPDFDSLVEQYMSGSHRNGHLVQVDWSRYDNHKHFSSSDDEWYLTWGVCLACERLHDCDCDDLGTVPAQKYLKSDGRGKGRSRGARRRTRRQFHKMRNNIEPRSKGSRRNALMRIIRRDRSV